MLSVWAFWGATEAGALPPDTVKGRLQQRKNDSEAEMQAAVTTARASRRFTGRCKTSLTERSARETIISHPSKKQLSSELVLISFESWSNEIVPPHAPTPKAFYDHGGGPAKTGSCKKLVSSRTGNPEGRA